MKFVDECRIKIKAGNGGNGAVSFYRGPHLPKGGPDGGNGGRGGSVYLVADPHLHSLLDFKYKGHFEAKRGQDGRGKQCHGRGSEDLELRLPLGTEIHCEETGEFWDLTSPDQKILVAEGGKGGRGNHSFRSSTLQAPRIATPGQIGAEKSLRLELKSLCDVGFVGLPNAGKSSLLTVLTSARPTVADYPFTTLNPKLGVLEKEGLRIQLADIPGLIEGAHENHGLGHRFLRHISRAKILLFLLSPQEEMSLSENLRQLLSELEAYDPELLQKDRLIVVNKSDLFEENQNFQADWETFQSEQPDAIQISALRQEGLEHLQDILCSKLFSDAPAELCYTEAQ